MTTDAPAPPPAADDSSTTSGGGGASPSPAPRDADVPLEGKLFELITLVWGVITLALIAPANGALVASRARLASTVILVAFGAFSLLAWWNARRGRRWVTAFFVGHLVALDAIWFPAGGSTSATLVFVFSLVLLPAVFARGWALRSMLLAIGLDVVGLFALEHAHPEWVVAYTSRPVRLVDVAITLLIAVYGVGAAVALVVRSYRAERRRLAAANDALASALAEVRTLEGLLPICAWCKRIRDERGRWTGLETYVLEHTNATPTHGICPTCQAKVEAEL